MQISEKIKVIPSKNEYLNWATCVGENNIAEVTRVSAFIIEEDNEHITFFLPVGLWKTYEPFLKLEAKLSMLTLSLLTMECYQLKGSYLKHQLCTQETIAYIDDKVQKNADVIDSIGMAGIKIIGYLVDSSSMAVTMKVDEIFVQTPKPGTGEKLKN